MFDSRESTLAGHFRSKRDQRELLCRVMRPWSSQPTKLSGDFDRKKCYDPMTADDSRSAVRVGGDSSLSSIGFLLDPPHRPKEKM